MIFSGKRNIIFSDKTRKIIFQCDFFWKDLHFRTLGERKYGFSWSEPLLAQSRKGTYTKPHQSFLPLPPSKPRSHMNSVFVGPITPSRILPVHQPVATKSRHLQSTYTPHLQGFSNRRRIWNPVYRLGGCSFLETVNFLRQLVVFVGKLHRGCFGRILYATLPNNLL